MVYKFILYCLLATLTAIPVIYLLTKSTSIRTYLNYFFFAWVANSIFQLVIAFIITFVLILFSIKGNSRGGINYVSTMKYVSIVSTVIWYIAGLVIVLRMEKSKKEI